MWTLYLSSERGTNGENGLQNQSNSNDQVCLFSKRRGLKRRYGAQIDMGSKIPSGEKAGGALT